eukprot:c17697_g1_i2 orf=1-843(-)
MEMANIGMGICQGSSFMVTERCSKGTDLNNRSMSDFFGIDNMLDFSSEDIGGPIEAVCWTTDSSSVIPVETGSSNSSVYIPNGLGSNEPGDLCIPCDDLAELEWLSSFVEESFCSGDASATVLSSSLNATEGEQKKLRAANQQCQSESPVSVLESRGCFSKPGSYSRELTVRGRARSKRFRSGVSIWNTSILSAVDSSSLALRSSSTGTVTSVSQSWEVDLFPDSVPSKAIKCNLSEPKNGQDPSQRRCLHCGSQRTPQWRAGPLGRKTLCNACGVRYKSG